MQELAPYSLKDEARVRMEGAQVLLEPDAAQAIAVTLHELATNAAIVHAHGPDRPAMGA